MLSLIKRTHPEWGAEESVHGGNLVDEGQVDVERVDGRARGLGVDVDIVKGVSVVEVMHPVRNALHHGAAEALSGHVLARTHTPAGTLSFFLSRKSLSKGSLFVSIWLRCCRSSRPCALLATH
jgi:hypothetical protein